MVVVGLVLAGFVGHVLVINRSLPQNENDVPILERTLALLENEERWSKQDDRTCEPPRVRLSLYCALRQASLEITGEFRHRGAALQEVRHEIDELRPDAGYAHRRMDFNNAPDVSLADVQLVIRRALDDLRAR